MRIGFIYKGGVQYFNDYTYPVPMQTMKIGVIYKIYLNISCTYNEKTSVSKCNI